MGNHLRATLIAALVGGLSSVTVPAQGPRTATIQCPLCSVSGQKPAPATEKELSQIRIIETLRPVVFDGRTVLEDVVARVLTVSPLLLEMLDGRVQVFDRNGKPVGADLGDYRCHPLKLIEAVEGASRPAVASLRLNDVLTGRLVMQEDPARPESILSAQPVLADVRRAELPVRYFNTPPTPHCSNRSGRLVQYRRSRGDMLTVFNDGGVHYFDTVQREFNRERLSNRELTQLLQAFADHAFDAAPSNTYDPKMGPPPGITLIAARVQDVGLRGNEQRLAPLVVRLDGVIARAMSQTSFLLRAGTRRRLTIEPWPYARLATLAGYAAAQAARRQRRDSGRTLASEPLDEPVPDEFLNRLPQPPQWPERDPNRFLYFSENGSLYRVMPCGRYAATCTFYGLRIERIETGEAQFKAQVEMQRVMSSGSFRYEDFHPSLERDVYLWSDEMFSRLAALPPAGATVPASEYEKHQALYRAMLQRQEKGVDLIENGIVYEGVRLCQMEKGVVDDCPVK